MSEDDDQLTSNPKVRHEDTGTLIAIVATVSPWVAAGSYLYTGAEIPIWLVSILVFESTTAAVWTFGASAAKAAKEAMSGGKQ